MRQFSRICITIREYHVTKLETLVGLSLSKDNILDSRSDDIIKRLKNFLDGIVLRVLFSSHICME